ncbi:sigma-70 family RNA polymerase sigma factor [Arenibacter sp. GZD96]|uniref:RNA polymerase sigma factor n=1 Tax=Aurantibrevibacter litoralis TaxID=3106030 RepID=UPI002AFFDDD7|nr:sigma-70 family RNA polymerase sigma factor [Arenibacter sp. GZD-96]MEA1786525.1 sigma-70 family RNA polymerase sigma factor [Arenibacter sp. GZD-96]
MKEPIKSVCNRTHFNALFDEHAEALRNFLYYRCGDLYQAEDLTQDAFVKLWDNCKKVIYEKAKGFLYAVAKNKFLNEVAHKKVVLAYANLPQQHIDNETPHFQMEGNEFMTQLQNAINQLPEGQREVFLLNRVDKKTFSEIAVMTGVSQTAVEKKMQKALLKIRKIIKNI